MSDNFWTFAAAVAWPAGIGGIVWFFKDDLQKISSSLVEKFKGATKLKIGSLELEGEYVQPKEEHGREHLDNGTKPSIMKKAKLDGNERSPASASKVDFDNREEIYGRSSYLMLCHKISPSKSPRMRFDISVFLVRKNRKDGQLAASFDEVESVTYYIGKYFGSGEYGSKFVVTDPANGFAIRTSAYGEPLCVADIKFKNGQSTQQYRFLDFSMREVFYQ